MKGNEGVTPRRDETSAGQISPPLPPVRHSGAPAPPQHTRLHTYIQTYKHAGGTPLINLAGMKHAKKETKKRNSCQL